MARSDQADAELRDYLAAQQKLWLKHSSTLRALEGEPRDFERLSSLCAEHANARRADPEAETDWSEILTVCGDTAGGEWIALCRAGVARWREHLAEHPEPGGMPPSDWFWWSESHALAYRIGLHAVHRELARRCAESRWFAPEGDELVVLRALAAFPPRDLVSITEIVNTATRLGLAVDGEFRDESDDSGRGVIRDQEEALRKRVVRLLDGIAKSYRGLQVKGRTKARRYRLSLELRARMQKSCW